MTEALPEAIASTLHEHLRQVDEKILGLRNEFLELKARGQSLLPWYEVEELHPLRAPRSLGERVHEKTLKRWASKGLYSRRTGRTIVLETHTKANLLYTSKERMLAFYRRHSGIKE